MQVSSTQRGLRLYEQGRPVLMSVSSHYSLLWTIPFCSSPAGFVKIPQFRTCTPLIKLNECCEEFSSVQMVHACVRDQSLYLLTVLTHLHLLTSL